MTSDRNFFTGGIFLNCTVNAGSNQQVPMRYSGGRVYRGELPGQLSPSTVEYWIIAKDFNNNVGTGPTQSFTVQTDCSGVNNCSGNGMCVGLDTCACDSGWSAPDCATPTPVPTVSAWGMAMMGLLVLTAATPALQRRAAGPGATIRTPSASTGP